MNSLEELKKRAESMNMEEFYNFLEGLNDENYLEEIKKAPYSFKGNYLLLSYEDDIDELLRDDEEFLERFKQDNSSAAITIKSRFNKEALDKYFDISEFEKECLEDESKLLDGIKGIARNNILTGTSNEILERVLSSEKLENIIVSNPKYLDEFVDCAHVSYRIIEQMPKNSKINDKILERAVSDIKESKAKDSYYSDVLKKLPDEYKDKVLNEVFDREQEKLSDEALKKVIQIVGVGSSDRQDIEKVEKANARIKALLVRNPSLLDDCSDNLLQEYLENVRSEEILDMLLENEKVAERIYKSSNDLIVEKVMNVDTSIDKKIEIIKKRESTSIRLLDKQTQLEISKNYTEYMGKVNVGYGIDSLDGEVVDNLLGFAEITDNLSLNQIVSLYQKGRNISAEQVKEKLLNNPTGYGVKSIPIEIINSCTKDEKKSIYAKINFNALNNLNKEIDEPLLKAITDQRVENEISKSFIMDKKSVYSLASDEQKEKLLEKLNDTELIALCDDEMAKNYVLNNKELLNSLNRSQVKDLISKMNIDEFERVKESLNASELVGVSVYGLSPELRDFTQNYVKELLEKDKSLYNNIGEYALNDLIKNANQQEREEIYNNLTTDTAISLINNYDEEELSKYKVNMAFSKFENEPVRYSYDFEKFINKLDDEQYERVVKELNGNDLLSLYKNEENKDGPRGQLILDTYKNEGKKIERKDLFSLEGVLKECNKEQREKIIGILGTSDLIMNYINDSSQNMIEVKKKVLEDYEDNIDKLYDIGEYQYRNFVSSLNQKDFEKISNANKSYILQNFDLKEQDKLYETLQNVKVERQLDVYRILKDGKYQEGSTDKRVLDYILSRNEYALDTLNRDMLSEEFYVYDLDLFEKISRYPDMQRQLVSQKDNNKLRIFNRMILNVSEGNDVDKTIPLISNLYEEVFVSEKNQEFLNMLDNDINREQAENVKEFLLRKRLPLYGLENTKGIIEPDINSKEDLYNYTNKLYEKCDQVFNNPDSTFKDKMNAFTTKYYGVSYDESKMIYNALGQGIGNWYKEQNFNEQEIPVEVTMLNTFETLINLEESNEVDNKNELLKNAYSNFEKINNRISRESIENTLEDCKRDIGREINNALYKPKEEDLEETIEFNGEKVPVYKLNGEFGLLVNSTAAYGKMEHKNSNYLDSWNNSDRTGNHGICCSAISDDYLGTAEVKDVLLGFSEFGDGALQSSAPYDLYTENDKFKTNVNRKMKMLTFRDLINNTRHTHNELDVERRELRNKSDIPEKDRNLENIQPSYVIVYDDMSDELRQNAYKCASDFKIPVVKINREECAKRNAQKIDKLIEEYDKTKDVSLLQKIIVSHENNRSGLRLERMDLVENYFDSNKIDKVLNDSINEIVDARENGTISIEEYNLKMKSIWCYIDDEEKKFDVTNETVARANNIDIDTIRARFNIEKDFHYYDKKNITIDEVLEHNEKIKLTKNDCKDINQILNEAKLVVGDKEVTQEEIESFERKVLYSQELMKNSNLDDKNKILVYKAQKFGLLSEEERNDIYNKVDAKNLSKNDRTIWASVELQDCKDEYQKERIIQKYRISDLEYENISKITDVVKNSNMIERGEFENTTLSKRSIESLKEIKESVDLSYKQRNEKKYEKDELKEIEEMEEIKDERDIQTKTDEESDPVI